MPSPLRLQWVALGVVAVAAICAAPISLGLYHGAIRLQKEFVGGAGGARGLGESRSVASEKPSVLSYIPNEAVFAGPANPAAAPSLLPPQSTPEQTAQAALAAYAGGNLAAGDALAAQVSDRISRLTLEWAALHAPTSVSLARFLAFLNDHPNWAGADWLVSRAEDALWREKSSPEAVEAFFAHRAPRTSLGGLALARARLAEGKRNEATDLVRKIWREDELFPSLETALRDQFGDMLTAADDKYRAEKLLYKGQRAAALRAAAHAGADELAIARVRIAAIDDDGGYASALKAVPQTARSDPSLLFAQIQYLGEHRKVAEAAKLLVSAPRDAAQAIDGDAWWQERRMLARKLLDHNDAKTAYLLCANYAPASPESEIDAEFHAGWIALRFLNDAKSAEDHFGKLAELAQTPLSRARAEYWLGRARRALHSPDANHSLEAAAAYPTTYYGQLAAMALGRSATPALHYPSSIAIGDKRDDAVQVVDRLEALGSPDAALTLAMLSARTLNDESQLAALAAVGLAQNDARETLAAGKIAERRGFLMDDAAFPTFGIPAYSPLANSAPSAIVYAVARQESAFHAHAHSNAGAHGLMQMILSTARRTAQKFKVPFTPARLTDDPAFNAELGAAHLGMLMSENRGSLILTFAAYNAGGGRVKEWIAAYGDPRHADVDPVDWVERIPIAETRDYVQRVMENFNVYKERFAHHDTHPGATPDVSAANAPALDSTTSPGAIPATVIPAAIGPATPLKPLNDAPNVGTPQAQL